MSGGQTGVDRAALDAALETGAPHGGWCPLGRLAEDGRIPSRYLLQETASRNYEDRTWRNVEDSDATLILHVGPIEGGTRLTLEYAERLDKLRQTVDLERPVSPAKIRAWLHEQGVGVLNVAGPRESKCPGIYCKARAYIGKLLADTAP